MTDEAFEAEVASWMKLLTANQRKIWRGVFAKGKAKTLVTVARAAGATHILFVHHGNAVGAATSPTGSADVAEQQAGMLTRELSNQGMAQSMVARQAWFGRLPVRSVILASPARCAQQTAMQMSGRASATGEEIEGNAPPVIVEALLPVGLVPEAESLFAHNGYGPLRAFLDEEGGERSFGTYAEICCDALCSTFRAKGKQREAATYIAVFGQAVYLNAVAHAVACAAGAPTSVLEPMLDADLGEAEGLLVPLHGGPVIQHLKRPL